jgi:hypothetical protein
VSSSQLYSLNEFVININSFSPSNYLALALIAVHNQSAEGLRFKVPWVPTIPALSIIANVALMVNLKIAYIIDA